MRFAWEKEETHGLSTLVQRLMTRGRNGGVKEEAETKGWRRGGEKEETEVSRAGRQLQRSGRLCFSGCHNGGHSRKSRFYIYTLVYITTPHTHPDRAASVWAWTVGHDKNIQTQQTHNHLIHQQKVCTDTLWIRGFQREVHGPWGGLQRLCRVVINNWLIRKSKWP